MSYIKRVKIGGLWGNHDIDFGVKREGCFLIGPNGTGKTTIVNIVAAALQLDFRSLDQAPFRDLEIEFGVPKSKRRPALSIKKVEEGRDALTSFLLSYKSAITAEVLDCTVSSYEADRIRHLGDDWEPRRRGIIGKNFAEISATLQEEHSSSWLSIHRTPSVRQSVEKRAFDRSVDIKVEEISLGISAIVSEMQNKADEETQEFQQLIFLMLIEENRASINEAIQKSGDYSTEEKELIAIFESFKLPKNKYLGKTRKYFENIRQGAHELTSKKPDDWGRDRESLVSTVINLSNFIKIAAIIDAWRTLSRKRKEIYFQRDLFVDIVNGLFSRKTMRINDSNKIFFESRSGKPLELMALSSGEKQMFILLGQAFLQRGRSWIYIADEPELSLHVAWQEGLVSNIQKLNPNAQILFATHSPDIVGMFADRIIESTEIVR